MLVLQAFNLPKDGERVEAVIRLSRGEELLSETDEARSVNRQAVSA